MHFSNLKPLLLTALLIPLSLQATETPPRSIGFQPLEIYEFKTGTSRLTVTDMNQDGLDDIIFANNHISRLEILIRKPNTAPSETGLPSLTERFENQGMIVDQQLKALKVADLNQDDRPDLLTFGTTIGLQVRYQQEDGSFAQPEHIFIENKGNVVALQLEDLNEDGNVDILVGHRDQAEILWNTDHRPFLEKKTLHFSSEKCAYLDVADINNDGTTDLIFHFSTTRNPLKVRFGLGSGSFGTEQSIDLPPRQYVDLIKEEGAPPKISMVLRNRLAYRQYAFSEKKQPEITDMQEAAPERIGLEGTAKKSVPAWIAADFNNDGFDDLLITAPEQSQLHLYRGGADGLNPEPTRIDTLSEVTRITRLPDGDIIVVSPQEKLAARHQADQLAQFPEILKTPGDVLAGCAMAQTDESWFVCKDADKKLQMVRMQNDGQTVSIYPLDLKNEPKDLMAFRLPGEKTGLLLFMPYDTPKFFSYQHEQLSELTSESFRALTQHLVRSNISLQAPGNGATLTVALGAVARHYKWTGERYEVTRQFNPENARGDLIASTPYHLLDGTSGTLLYDQNATDLIRFTTPNQPWNKINIPDANQTIFDLVQLKNPERDTLVLLDRTGLNVILGNGTRLTATMDGEYISPSEKPRLTYSQSVRLGSPPRTMTALVDQANRNLELITDKNGALLPEMIFEVFLVSDFATATDNRSTEPHDLESGDLNGDGMGDLVLLCQDKLIIYLGE